MSDESPKGGALDRLLVDAPQDVRTAAEDSRRVCGKYVLVSALGRGGMGVVWRAWDARLSRMVALKFLTAEASRSATVVERLINEARIAARLVHENICQVYDVASHAGRHYIAMQLVSGKSLDQVTLPPQELARVLKKCALALDLAHDQGIIHRDIKPGNVMLDDAGTPYVMDFGIAKNQASNQQMTQAGTVIGSPSFMSPEQGAGGAIDRRSDVYSLGATLYAGLCGQPPFDGEGPLQVLLKVATLEPVPPSQRAPNVPPELERISLKAMAKEPADRYPTTKAVAEELERYLEQRTAPLAETMPMPALPRVGGTGRTGRPASATLAARGMRPSTTSQISSQGTGRRATRQSTVDRRSRGGQPGPNVPAMALMVAAGAIVLGALVIASSGGNPAVPDPTTPPIAKGSGSPHGTGSPAGPGSAIKPVGSGSGSANGSGIGSGAATADALATRMAKIEDDFSLVDRELSLAGTNHVRVRRQLDEVVTGWGEILEADERCTRALVGRARAELLQFSWGAAARDLDLAIELAPRDPVPYIMRARLVLTLEIELRYAMSWVLGPVREAEMAQRRQAAISDMRIAKGNGVEEPALEALIAFAEQRYIDCLDLCDAVLAENPERWDIAALRGDARYFGTPFRFETYNEAERKALGAARVDYDLALERRPNDYLALLMRGNVLEKIGYFDLARTDFELALERRQNDPLACWFLGQYHSARATQLNNPGMRVQALSWYERGLEGNPDSFPNLVGRATVLATNGDNMRALADIDRAVTVNPAHYHGWYMKSAVLGRMGRNVEAITACQKALECRPDFSSGWYNLGAIAYNASQWKTARDAWAKAVDLGHAQSEQLREHLKALDKRIAEGG